MTRITIISGNADANGLVGGSGIMNYKSKWRVKFSRRINSKKQKFTIIIALIRK